MSYSSEQIIRIALDNRSTPGSGIARYVENLQFHLAVESPITDVVLFEEDPSFGLEKVQFVRSSVRLAYEWALMDRDLRALKVDLFHCTKNYGVPISKCVPVVTTVHDVIPLALGGGYTPTRAHWLFFQLNFRVALSRSAAIITISKFSRDEIVRFFPNCRQKIHYIPQGCDPDFNAGMTYEQAWKIMRSLGVSRPYVLTMGGGEPRKNVAIVTAAHEACQEQTDLVVLGGRWRERLVPRSRREGVQCHLLNGLSQEELVAAYTAATVFVYPSLYEGFGLPTLEAMACGTPVLAHNCSSIPEVVGNAAVLVDMRDSDACRLQLNRLLQDQAFREDMVAAGKERVKLFSWNNTAKRTAEIYQYVAAF